MLGVDRLVVMGPFGEQDLGWGGESRMRRVSSINQCHPNCTIKRHTKKNISSLDITLSSVKIHPN